jgi:predicted transcriptional regulator
MENQQNEEKVFTPEELDAKRKEMLKYYTDSTPYLKAQYDHEELLMKIDEVRFKRTNLQMQYAMLMDQMQNSSEEEEDDKTPPPYSMPEEESLARKLKKQ